MAGAKAAFDWYCQESLHDAFFPAVVSPIDKTSRLTAAQRRSLHASGTFCCTFCHSELLRADAVHAQDTDGNGSISIEELREGLTTVIGSETDPAAADGIMAALDVSGDGEINYSEFLAAVCDHQRMLADHTLAGIFGEPPCSAVRCSCAADTAATSSLARSWQCKTVRADGQALAPSQFLLSLNQFCLAALLVSAVSAVYKCC